MPEIILTLGALYSLIGVLYYTNEFHGNPNAHWLTRAIGVVNAISWPIMAYIIWRLRRGTD